jgi:hypothetical protein
MPVVASILPEAPEMFRSCYMETETVRSHFVVTEGLNTETALPKLFLARRHLIVFPRKILNPFTLLHYSL